MERVAEEEVRIAPGLSVGGVRGTERCGSSLGLFLRLSPELSVVDVGEAAGGEVILAPGLSVGGVGGRVNGATSTGISLRMSPELSVGDVGTAAVGARLSPGLSIGGVGGRVLRVDAPSARLTPELSVGAMNGRVGWLLYNVSQRVGVLVDRLILRAAAVAQVPFEGDAFSPP